MSTSYFIEVGYNSAHELAEVGEKLCAVVADIRANPQRITDEVRRVEPGISAEELEGFIESYRSTVSDLTCCIVYDEDNLPRVLQCASGGGRSRALKEICRRAFARLVLAEMHRKHMDVSFTVS